jgi:guanylate kinase
LGIILYGPPASGKDTVTTALATLSPRYVHFPRLKVGGGATATYRMTTAEELRSLNQRGDLIWANHRYGSTYAVDRPELLRALAKHTPVVHLGQVAAVQAVRDATPDARWFIVGLWCPLGVAQQRLIERGATDLEARLRAWHETEPLPSADATFNTAQVAPAEAAAAVHARVLAAAPVPGL